MYNILIIPIKRYYLYNIEHYGIILLYDDVESSLDITELSYCNNYIIYTF